MRVLKKPILRDIRNLSDKLDTTFTLYIGGCDALEQESRPTSGKSLERTPVSRLRSQAFSLAISATMSLWLLLPAEL